MLKYKKSITGDVTTELTEWSDGLSSEIDLTWLGRISSAAEAIALAQHVQTVGLSAFNAQAAGSSGSGGAAAAMAAPDVDLTVAGNFGSVGDGVFMTGQIQAGTGLFDTFVQVHAGGQEHGYNTDHRPQQFDERNSANHNHSLLLSNVGIVVGDGSGGTNDGTVYREFILDANDGNGGRISLDRLQIFQEASGNLTGFVPGVGFGAPGEHLVYDLDAGGDRWVALNANLSSGSGNSDIRVLIPDVLFDQSLPYVVLYSGFGFQGGEWTSDGGFEEWGTDTANSPGGGGPFALNITKNATIAGGTADAAGEVITYAIRVVNTGTANLTGITVTDPFVSNLARGADIVGNNDTVLNAGEIWSYSADHTVTQDEIDNDELITNTATADSDQTGPDTASTSVTIDRNPHVTLTKNAAIVGGAVDAPGDVIHYRLTATNDGNMTLTNPQVTDPQFTSSTPVDGAPVTNPDAQIFIPILDGDYNLGDTDNDGIEELTDHNGVWDPGEVFQYVYPGDTDQNGRHDPGETWVAFNLGDADNDGFRDPGETFVGDADNNGIEDNGETWSFKNLGDVNNNNLQDNGEVWQYVNAGDNDQNGVEDPGETFLYYNIGDTNQSGSEDGVETFQFYNAGDSNQNGVEDDGETFQFIVTNTVVSVDDDEDGFNDGDTNLDGRLSVGETWKYTATYTATQDDIDNRDGNGIPIVDPALTHDNTATVTVDQPTSDTASASVPITQNPDLAVVKTVSSITSTDEAVGTTSVDAAGDVINYTVTVENTGNMTLTGIVVSDPLVADLAYASGDANEDGEIDVDETWTYTGSYMVQQSDIDNGGVVDPALTIDNTATADSAQTDPEDASASVPVDQDPDLEITKIADVASVDAAGDVINYTVTVENTGNMTLTGIVVSDPLVADLAYASGDANEDGDLDLDETWTYAGSYMVQQSDIDNGGVVDPALTIDNTATADSDQTDPEDAGASVAVDQNPDLEITKTADVTSVDAAGDVINYTVTVENTGNMTLTGLTVSDPLVTNFAYTSGDADEDGALDLTETWTYTGSYTVLQADIDNNGGGDGDIDNTATADSAQTDPELASHAVTVEQPAVASMTLDKSDAVGTHFVDSNEDGNADAGIDLIQYVFQVTNTGGVTLTDIEVDDPLVGPPQSLPDLDPGETANYSINYFLTQADVDRGFVHNEASATALDPFSVVVIATTEWDVILP